MTQQPVEIPPHPFQTFSGPTDAGGAWKLLSPGTGGNMHALGLPANRSDVIWVGTDNGGMNWGGRNAKTGRWSFSGAQAGIFSYDVSDICALRTLQGSSLTYCIAGTGVGAGNSADLRVLYRRRADFRWEPVELASATHVWSTGLPPATDSFKPALPNDWLRTPNTHMTAPSFVRVLPLPGAPGRHLLVIGGNNGSVRFEGGRIRIPTTMSSYEQKVKGSATDTEDVYVSRTAPNFYCCIAEAPSEDSPATYGSWVGATYEDDNAKWASASGALVDPKDPGKTSTDRRVAYAYPTAVGSLWLDPTPQTPDGTTFHLYFTIRIAPPAAAEIYRIVRMAVQVPAAGLTGVAEIVSRASYTSPRASVAAIREVERPATVPRHRRRSDFGFPEADWRLRLERGVRLTCGGRTEVSRAKGLRGGSPVGRCPITSG